MESPKIYNIGGVNRFLLALPQSTPESMEHTLLQSLIALLKQSFNAKERTPAKKL